MARNELEKQSAAYITMNDMEMRRNLSWHFPVLRSVCTIDIDECIDHAFIHELRLSYIYM